MSARNYKSLSTSDILSEANIKGTSNDSCDCSKMYELQYIIF